MCRLQFIPWLKQQQQQQQNGLPLTGLCPYKSIISNGKTVRQSRLTIPCALIIGHSQMLRLLELTIFWEPIIVYE